MNRLQRSTAVFSWLSGNWEPIFFTIFLAASAVRKRAAMRGALNTSVSMSLKHS